MSKTTKRLAGCLALGTAACGTTEPLEWPLLVEFEVEVQYVKPDPGLVQLSLTLEDRAAEWQQYHAGGPAAGLSTHQRAVAKGVAGTVYVDTLRAAVELPEPKTYHWWMTALMTDHRVHRSVRVGCGGWREVDVRHRKVDLGQANCVQ